MPKTPRNTTIRNRARARLRATGAACYICGKPIDYTLRTPDPGSFEADHITALANGGTNTLDNFAATHRECNSKKRARTFAPIVRRSGVFD